MPRRISRRGRPIVDDKQLEPAYQQIEQSFVKKPFVVAPQERYAGGPVEAVREILARHRLSDAEQSQLQAETFGPKDQR